MEGLPDQLNLGLLGPARQLRGWHSLAILLGHRHPEPLLQVRVDHLAVDRADVRAVRVLRPRRATHFAGAVGEAESVLRVVEAVDLLQPRPGGVELRVPLELVGVDERPGGDAANDDVMGEAAGGAAAQAARALPVALAEPGEVAVRVLGGARLRLPAAEVERHQARNPRVERRGHAGRVAAAGHRPEQDDPVLVDGRLLQQHVDAAHQVPRHPAHQRLADDRQLQRGVVAEVVVLARRAEGLGVVLLGAEVVLPPLAVAEVVGHEHGTPGPCPRHARGFALTQSV